MSSDVSICNLSLSHIGQDGVITDIDPPDGTAEADYAAQFYPIARDEVLEKHAWRFATFRQALAPLAVNELEGMWGFAYAVPNLMLRALVALPPESVSDENAVPFEIEAQSDGTLVVYTNQESAWLKYIKQVTDTSKFTPGFVVAFSYKLAQYMAGPITKRPEVIKAMENAFDKAYLLATAADASSRRKDLFRNYVPGHIGARKV